MAANPNPVDVHVGSRIRLRRTLLGMSQEKLGTAIGLTFQQVQKYERGTNRVGSSRLFQLSKVLNVPVSFFFDDMPAEVSGPKGHLQEASEPFADNPLTKRETLELVRAYHRIATAPVRKRVFELVKSLADLTNPK
ncbi:MAG: helix-turn-helix transcriptional regulator [Alphaproteobacteria bacterium]|jgi:transcriptional regulator with XRE-family HTH domain|nr:helix-turn-helix transcriptional regulator [Alphaproteobacteria bacterium]MDP6516443.1 helix-turn-helix transcriptional regulator [Alphaproteobacteria bacterium]|tara:strand:+ start:534 stop:941 length:408 start_codon:yes stop_codon:yes gene_type:complete